MKKGTFHNDFLNSPNSISVIWESNGWRIYNSARKLQDKEGGFEVVTTM
jgi:hypothetical protein